MNRRCRWHARTQDGLSLVELMVAITLGLIILAAVAQIFVSSRTAYTLEEGLARVQEAGRFAMDFLVRDIRMAGYSGCLPKSGAITNNLNNNTDPVGALGNYVTGHRYAGSGGTALADWNPDLPGTVNSISYFTAGEVRANTDVLIIRRASEVNTMQGEQMPNTSADLKITGNPAGFTRFDILFISDCERADIFQITNPASWSSGTNNLVHNTGVGTPGNSTTEFSKPYGTNAEIMKLITRIYYIGTGAGGKPALFRKEFTGGSFVASELVEGIEDMRVTYGVDTDGDRVPEKYIKADDVTAAEWRQVVTVRVGILASTNENVDLQPELTTFDLAGINVAIASADSKKRHRAFNSTVKLRN